MTRPPLVVAGPFLVIALTGCIHRTPPAEILPRDLVRIGPYLFEAATSYALRPLVGSVRRFDLDRRVERQGIGLSASVGVADDLNAGSCPPTATAWRRDSVRVERVPADSGDLAVRWRRTYRTLAQGDRRARLAAGCVREEMRSVTAWTDLAVRLRLVARNGESEDWSSSLLVASLDSGSWFVGARLIDSAGRDVAPAPTPMSRTAQLYPPRGDGGLQLLLGMRDTFPQRPQSFLRPAATPCFTCLSGARQTGGVYVTTLAHAMRVAGFSPALVHRGYARWDVEVPASTLVHPLGAVVHGRGLWECEDPAACRAPPEGATFADVAVHGTSRDLVVEFTARRRILPSPGPFREERVRAHFGAAIADGQFVLASLLSIEFEPPPDEPLRALVRGALPIITGYRLFPIDADGVRRERRFRTACLVPSLPQAEVAAVTTRGALLSIAVEAPIMLEEPEFCPRR